MLDLIVLCMSDEAVDLDHLLRNAPFPALVVDDEYTVQNCNQKWASVVNASTPETVIGMSSLEFLPEDEHKTSKERLQTVIRDNEPADVRTYIFRTINGNHKTARGGINPISGSDCAYIILRDISDISETEVEAEKRRRQIEQLHEVSTSLNSATSKEEVAEKVVDAIEDVLNIHLGLVSLVEDGYMYHGASTDELQEEMYYETSVDSEKVNVTAKAYKNEQTIYIEDTDEHPEIKVDTSFKSALLVPMGQFGVVQSVSFEKHAFDETDKELVTIVTAHAREAMDRIEREQEIEQRKENLETLKTVYSRVFRHNFRNEALITQSNSEMIIEQSENPNIVEAAQTMLESTERLIAHAEKAREIKKIIDSTQDMSVVDMKQKATKAVSKVRRNYPDARIIEDVDPNMRLKTHPHVETAIVTAVENSVIHNDEDVTVEVYSTRDAKDGIGTIVVEDTGAGIPENERKAINEAWETDLLHSSGVGLWVIKFITQISNGDLQITNTEDGARVELILPLPDQ
jgi:PAS domain S-box-containing protein